MEMREATNLRIGISISSFIALILLLKLMSTNRPHNCEDHNHSPKVEQQDTTQLDSVHVVPVQTKKTVSSDSLDVLVKAMIQVESRGNDSAYHAGEKAAGCLQIRPIMVKEVNRLLKRRGDSRRFTMADRWDRLKSIEMFKVFNKSKTSLEVMARRWNGGPIGHKKSATIGYWKKVIKNMKS